MDDGNIAYHVDDNPSNVTYNREQLCKKHHLNFSHLKSMNQTHSNTIKVVNTDDSIYDDCDGIITNLEDTPLMVMVADCIPILFFDKNKNVIGVAHAGRNGTYQNISGKMVQKMKDYFSCNPKDIQVILGPSIQKCCYEVSLELATIAKKSFGIDVVKDRFVDLQAINKKQLLDANIDEKNINISKICTKCSHKNYYSYRNDTICGRFCGIINIRKQ